MSKSSIPDRWSELEPLLDAALEHASRDRPAFLESACGEDQVLRDELESLLAECDRPDSLFAGGAVEQFAALLADPLRGLPELVAGRYRVVREIGAGGMATVYLARDLKHDRDVALKVLNPELSLVLGIERFLSEIKITANLQHPNLLPLFDSGAADGLLFYVMPFVDGESLRHRLLREKQLPVEEAVHIAIAVARALDYAHSRDVIHRDLKPENILLQRGQPVVADFGIALAISNAGGQRVTKPGLSLGTPQYMSPEQATHDRIIDGRADVFSLAAVLYEMLTGDPPHSASTAQAIIAKVLTDRAADVRVIRSAVSEPVAHAIQRALEKVPADRWGTAAQFADALRDHAVSASSPAAPPTRASHVSERRARRAATIALAISIVIAVSGLWAWAQARNRAAPPTTTARFSLAMPANVSVARGGGSPLEATPNGKTIVFAAEGANGLQLYRRAIDELEAIPIAGTAGAASSTSSPDGRWLAFVADSQLKKIPIEGGTATTIARASGFPNWGPGDVIVLGTLAGRGGLSLVSAASGAIRPLTQPDTASGEESHRWPRVLPDGQTVLFTIWPRRGGLDSTWIGIASLETGTHAAVDRLGLGTFPLGVFHGYLVYGRRVDFASASIMAVAIDLRHSRAIGEPAVIVEGVDIGTAGALKATLSAGGTLAYQTGSEDRRLVLVDMHGTPRTLIAKAQSYAFPAFSPDGGKIALTIDRAIWVYDIGAGTLSPLTAVGPGALRSFHPSWTPDGKRLAFVVANEKDEIYWQAADASERAKVLATSGSAGLNVVEPTFSRDGRWLIYRTGEGTGAARNDRREIWYRSLSGDTTSKLLRGSRFTEDRPSLSPDGHWLAYMSDESGQSQVYVCAFPGPAAKWPVSDGPAREPRWSLDGQTIFYRSAQGMIAAHVRTSPTFSVKSREVLFADRFLTSVSHQAYDISPDGKRFVMVQRGDSSSVVVVTNWLAELRARMAATGRK